MISRGWLLSALLVGVSYPAIAQVASSLYTPVSTADVATVVQQQIQQTVKGDPGPVGPAGPAGKDGAAGATGAAGKDSTVPGPTGATGTAGKDSTVPGPQGVPGVQGAVGAIGAAGAIGASAYQVAVANGYTGTQAQWLASLVGAIGQTGATGATGAAGSSAYQVAVANGFTGTQAQWLTSLVGATGQTGGVGQTGATGTAATIAVGGVTALGAGVAPTVTNSGTSSAAVLNFGLPGGAVFLADTTVSQTALVAVNAGYRTLTATLTGCQVNERVMVTPTNLQAGYSVADAYCATAGVLSVNVYAPALSVGASYTITMKTTVWR